MPIFEHASLGILPTRLAPADGKAVEIRSVLSKASHEALSPGDLITAVNGTVVESNAALREILGQLNVGDQVVVKRKHGESEGIVEITLQVLESSIPPELAPTALPALPTADNPPAVDPAAEQPAKPEKAALKAGRISKKLAGSERTYWVNIPATYRPGQPHGLIVWLAPKDEPEEAAILKQWKAACELRGMILVVPQPPDL